MPAHLRAGSSYSGVGPQTASAGGGGGGGGGPTLPSDQVIGTPASRQIDWGSSLWSVGRSSSDYSTWYARGHQGWKAAFTFGYSYGGTDDFQGSDASGLSGSQWASQKAMEGAGGTVALAAAAGDETYLGFYLTQYQSGIQAYFPPYGTWWDDTLWSGVVAFWQRMAQAASYMGMTGLSIDTEVATWALNSDQQTSIVVTGGPTSGTFTLTYRGQTTASIAYNATPAAVQTALAALSDIGTGNVVVSGSAGTYDVVLAGSLTSGFPIALGTNALGGGTTPSVTVTQYAVTDVAAKARARGNSIAQAIWGAKSNLILLWYSFYPRAGWNDKFQQVVNGSAYPFVLRGVQEDFLQGLLDGMRTVGATGRIVIADASFYRSATNQIGDANATNKNAYFLNSQAARAYASTYFDPAVWNYAVDHLDIVGFTWRGTDNATFNNNTEPSDATWSQWLLDSRNYSEGPRRVEYNYDGWAGSLAAFGTGSGTDLYASAAAISGAQAAADTTPISTSVPTLTSVSASATGGTVTLACNAAHAYGIRYVKVYDGSTFTSSNPSASYLGSMGMTFQANGGNYNTNYNSAYQACTYATPGSSGHWFVLEAVSIKDDTHWISVQVP